jgi:hypothetical protein
MIFFLPNLFIGSDCEVSDQFLVFKKHTLIYLRHPLRSIHITLPLNNPKVYVSKSSFPIGDTVCNTFNGVYLYVSRVCDN